MKRIVICGIGLLINMVVYCQRHKFEKVQLESTILNSEIIDLMQDDDGFIWVASAEGLGRYDGHNIIEYKHYKNIEKSICNNRVLSIQQAPNGLIWMGTKGGLSVYDPKNESTRCLYHDGKNVARGDNIVLSVLVDRLGYIWYSTYNGLYRMDPKTEEREIFLPEEDNPHTISTKLVFSIFEDSQGVIWFANNNGVSYYNNDGTFHFVNFVSDGNESYGLRHRLYFTFCETDDGKLWLGGDSGYYEVVRQGVDVRFVNYKHEATNPNSLSYDYVNDLMTDGQDLYVSTWAGGLNKVVFDHEGKPQYTHYRNIKDEPHSLQTDEVNVTMVDRSGVLWVGTSFGLMKSSLSTKKFGLIESRPNVAHSLTNNKVQASLVDSRGNLWVGTDDGLNFQPARHRLDDAHFSKFIHSNEDDASLTHDNIFDIYEDSSHRIWISTYNGFSIADLNTFENNPHFTNIRFDKVPHKWVYHILETEKNNFWVSTYGKMAKMYFPPGAKVPDLKVFDMDPSDPRALSNATTYQTCKDGKGRVWVATFFGLSMIEERDGCTSFVNYYKERNQAGSISEVTINCLFLDRGNRFWIGTRNGLNLTVEDGRGNIHFKTFDEFNGLPNARIQFIEEDFQGKLWIGTADGVVHFDPEKAEEGGAAVINTYTTHDGLGKNHTIVRSSCRDAEGNIYFGSEGLNYFNPNRLVFNDKKPKLIFTRVKVLNQDVKPGENGILKSSISRDGNRIDLRHDDNMIQLFFSSLDFTNPQKNRYRYKMEGLNEDWVDAGSQNSATFTNLSSGSYLFKAMGSNNDGVWSDEAIALTIVVAPHWAMSKWAISLYFLLTLTILGLIYRWRKERAKEKIQIIKDLEFARLEERERLRKKNAADFHDELGHRLTKIALFLEIARKQVDGNAKLEEYLTKVKTNTKSLSDGLKDLIWSLDPTKDSILDTINRIQEVGDDLFDYSEMTFSTRAVDSVSGKLKLSPTERKHILLIFKEAISNALKYSRADQCMFRSEMESDAVQFIFQDNGRGFDMEDCFMGNGLKNMKERAEKIGGEFLLDTGPDGGTKITVRIGLEGREILENEN